MQDWLAMALAKKMSGGGSGSDSAGGDGKIASGSITPLDYTFEIVHNLGEKPAVFMWYPEFVSITGRVISDCISAECVAFDSADWDGHVAYKTKPVLIMTEDKIISYSISNNIDWGYFTVEDIASALSTTTIYCDEKKFYGKTGAKSIMPHSVDGNITLHWFAIGGLSV